MPSKTFSCMYYAWKILLKTNCVSWLDAREEKNEKNKQNWYCYKSISYMGNKWEWKHELVKTDKWVSLTSSPWYCEGEVMHVKKEIEQNDILFWCLNTCPHFFFMAFASLNRTGVIRPVNAVLYILSRRPVFVSGKGMLVLVAGRWNSQKQMRSDSDCQAKGSTIGGQKTD